MFHEAKSRETDQSLTAAWQRAENALQVCLMTLCGLVTETETLFPISTRIHKRPLEMFDAFASFKAQNQNEPLGWRWRPKVAPPLCTLTLDQ